MGTKPKVTAALKDAKVTAPKEVTLKAEISPGEPRAAIHWYKDAKEIYASRKHTMKYTENVAELTIHTTELNDSATYRCEADNKVGRVETQGTLTVMGKLKW